MVTATSTSPGSRRRARRWGRRHDGPPAHDVLADGRVGPVGVASTAAPRPRGGTHRASGRAPAARPERSAAVDGGQRLAEHGRRRDPSARIRASARAASAVRGGPGAGEERRQLGALGVEARRSRCRDAPARPSRRPDLQHRSADEAERHREQHRGVVVVDAVGRSRLGEQLVEPVPLGLRDARSAGPSRLGPDGRAAGRRPRARRGSWPRTASGDSASVGSMRSLSKIRQP